MNIYDFKLKDKQGNEVSLEKYKGKVLLVVNIATKCGLTPQLDGLQKMYDQYKEQGLEILGIPCDQFLHQSPGTDAEISEFCSLNYGVTFDTFAKIDVNGKEEHPLYTYLKGAVHTEDEDAQAKSFQEKLKSLGQAVVGTSIKWNFTKFLVNKEGKVVARFSPTYSPDDIAIKMEALLNS